MKYGAEVNAKDSSFLSPLYRSLNNSPIDFKTVKLLLKYGASVHESDTIFKITEFVGVENILIKKLVKELLKYALTEHADKINCIYCNRLCSSYSKYRHYILELNKMKNKYIVDKLTLYDIVVYNVDYGKMYSKDQDVLSNFYFLRYIRTEYPKYYDIILNALRTKEYILSKFCDLFVFAENDRQIGIYLNSDCLREIGRYISKDDMTSFLEASLLQ